MRPPELLPHLLDLELATEEVLRVLLEVNAGQAGVGAASSARSTRRVTSSSARASAAALGVALLGHRATAFCGAPAQGVSPAPRAARRGPLPDLLARLECRELKPAPHRDHLGQHHTGGNTSALASTASPRACSGAM